MSRFLLEFWNELTGIINRNDLQAQKKIFVGKVQLREIILILIKIGRPHPSGKKLKQEVHCCSSQTSASSQIYLWHNNDPRALFCPQALGIRRLSWQVEDPIATNPGYCVLEQSSNLSQTTTLSERRRVVLCFQFLPRERRMLMDIRLRPKSSQN